MAATSIFFIGNIIQTPGVYGPVSMLTAVDYGPWREHPGWVAVSESSATVLKGCGSPVKMIEHADAAVGRTNVYLVPGWVVEVWFAAENVLLFDGGGMRGGRRAAELAVKGLMKMSESDQRAALTMMQCVRNDSAALNGLIDAISNGRWWSTP